MGANRTTTSLHAEEIRMGTDNRYTKKGRHSYRTRSNRTKPIRTPGGRLVGQIIKKKNASRKCGVCKGALPGLKCVRAAQWKNLKKRERTVSRAYGGSVCGHCLREKITRAFLLEEQKAVKKLLAERQNKK